MNQQQEIMEISADSVEAGVVYLSTGVKIPPRAARCMRLRMSPEEHKITLLRNSLKAISTKLAVSENRVESLTTQLSRAEVRRRRLADLVELLRSDYSDAMEQVHELLEDMEQLRGDIEV